MSNKVKGFEIHPNNELTYAERRQKSLIIQARRNSGYGQSKHIGSKSLKQLMQLAND